MKEADPQVAASYRHCRRIARRAASNFAWTFWLLPAPQRRAMDALYAFARHSDDLVDDPATPSPADSLAAWRRETEEALAGAPCGPILPALADAARRFAIPHRPLLAILDGVALDLAPPRFACWEELDAYCRLVASAVGEACLWIWGFTGEQAFAPASDCGVAFQLTNILRDLREDAARGRCYLPADQLAQFGLSREELLAGAADERVAALLEHEVQRAESFYARAAAAAPLIHLPGRRVFRLMFSAYRRLLETIRRRGVAGLACRARLGWSEKLALAAGAVFS